MAFWRGTSPPPLLFPMSLKMALVGVQIKHFKSALQCLGRIGETRSLHAAHTAYSMSQRASHTTSAAVPAGPELLIEALPEKVHMIDTHLLSFNCPQLAVGSRRCSTRGGSAVELLCTDCMRLKPQRCTGRTWTEYLFPLHHS